MIDIFLKLLILNIDISGKLFNVLQLLNILFISLTLIMLHIDISGKDESE